jgi:hypothetical protein
MKTNLDLIGTFHTSKDNFKFVVESTEDSTASIRFLHNGICKTVSIPQIKNKAVTSKITKATTKKQMLPTGFEVNDNTNKDKTCIKGIGLKLLSIDASTESTGVSIYHGNKLIFADKISTSTTSGRFRKIRIMCQRIEELIDEHKINHVVLEDIYMGKSVASFLALANLQGALADLFKRKNINFTLVYASEWKGYFSILTKRDIGKIKSIQLCQEITGQVFQEDIAESILIGYYTIKKLVNWFA